MAFIVCLVFISRRIWTSIRSIHVGEHPKSMQEHYLEETFKMRNLLEEFENRKPRNENGESKTGKYGHRPPTILGVREHVFTGRCRLISPSFINIVLDVEHCFRVMIGQTCNQAILKQFMIALGSSYSWTFWGHFLTVILVAVCLLWPGSCHCKNGALLHLDNGFLQSHSSKYSGTLWEAAWSLFHCLESHRVKSIICKLL